MRRTGRTFRICLEACLLASDGKNVFFLYDNMNHYNDLFETIFSIASKIEIKINRKERKITFPNSSSIYFMYDDSFVEEKTRGIEDVVIVRDHS